MMTRREMLAGAAGLALLSGCARQQAKPDPSRVSIVRAPAYDERIYQTVRELVAQHNPDVRGKRVVLKPNLVEFDAQTTINTHPIVVHAAYEAFLAMGAASVRIAEGPGHRRNTMDLADAAGYLKLIPKFEDLFVDLNLDDVSHVQPTRNPSKLEKLYLPHTVLGADLLVSMPKMKTHHWVGATLSMKNLFGTVPGGVYGWPKNPLHWAGISESVAMLHSVYPRQFAIVDGVVGMEGNGPVQGTPKTVGVLVAGSNPVTVDATCCRIMRIDPERIDYLRLATEGLHGRFAEENIQQIGERISTVAMAFELPPDFPQIRLKTA